MPAILNEDGLKREIDALVAAHPVFGPIRLAAGEVPLRWLDPGFHGLVWVITGQQISVAAGRAIFTRLEAGLGEITAEALAGADDGLLKAAGYSAAKIRTIRAVQASVISGSLDLDALLHAPAEQAIASLCAIKGIGPWTAEVYLLFAAGHGDIFPAADLALQESARLAFALKARPPAKEFYAMVRAWSPHRSAAARLLWAYYRAKKGGAAAGTPI